MKQKYLDIFAREAEEHLQILRKGLLALEKEAFSAERIHELLRSGHTLKGSARLVGLEELGQVAHLIEDIFKSLETGERLINPELIDVLFLGTDAVEALIAQAHSAGDISVNVEQVLTALETGAMPESKSVSNALIKENSDHIELETVRTSVVKLDQLVNLMGEILISQRLFDERGRNLRGLMGRIETFMGGLRKAENYRTVKGILDNFSQLSAELDRDTVHLEYLVRELHGSAMELRMLPLSAITEDLEVMARSLAREQGKNLQLDIIGKEVELDRMMLEALKPMLLHMLRNAVDHGLESPEERQRAQKTLVGRIELTARYELGLVRLVMRDDGSGIDPVTIRRIAQERGVISAEEARLMSDEEAVYLILRPGFSTREFITDVSGRGVGMDVVKSNIDRVKGNLVIHSTPGQGTEMILHLPLTMAVINSLAIDCEGETYAVPLHYVTEILRLREEDIFTQGAREVVRVRDRMLPLFDLATLLGIPRQASTNRLQRITVMVLNFREQQVAFTISESYGTQELVAKNLGKQLKRVRFFSGATVLADGTPALIMSVPDLFTASIQGSGTQLRKDFASHREKSRKGNLLVVDDSITTRTMEKNILETHGFSVTLAVSGEDALEKLRSGKFDLMISDVEMPGISGFELTRRVRSMENTQDLPVIIVSSLASDEHRRTGIEVGAQAYIVKGKFDQGTLLETVEALIG